jgi:hypothetical protein
MIVFLSNHWLVHLILHKCVCILKVFLQFPYQFIASLIDYLLFMSRSISVKNSWARRKTVNNQSIKKFSLIYGDVPIAGEGLQNLGLSRDSGPLSREESLSSHTYCDQKKPTRIRVRIDPPHPLVCRKRRLNGAVRKNRGPMSQQVWHDKDPSLLKGPERRA